MLISVTKREIKKKLSTFKGKSIKHYNFNLHRAIRAFTAKTCR